MRVQHNIMAMNAYRNYTNNVSAMKKNLERLSSGYKINRAGDDAAGLAISEKMRAQITGLEAAQKNAKDGISLVQTAEGALTEVHDMLNRMVELATQSANGTYDNDTDRYQLQKEMNELKAEINRIADSANFNGIKLLDGSMSTSAGSAIINIENTAFQKATSADGAFSFDVVRVRPNSGAKGTKASFEISLDDLNLHVVGTEAAEKVSISITIGDTTFTLKPMDIATGTRSAASLANIILNAIKEGSITDNKLAGASGANGVGKLVSTGGGSYVKIQGHIWKMSAVGGKLTFTQVDEGYMKETDDAIIPDGWGVSISIEQAGKGGTVAFNDPNTNWFVQNTKYYDPSGAGLQARAQMTVDFAKIKDGDKITIGSKTFTIYLDQFEPSSGGTLGIYLKGIDLEDEKGQKMALDKIVEKLSKGGTNWTVGNGGVQLGGTGLVTFQSLSDKETNGTNNAGTNNKTKLDLSTDTKVLNQFKYKSTEKGATVSFEVDPTMIHEGDTFTLNGLTFEFTKTASKVSSSGNIAVALGSVFDEDGGADLSASAVADKIKTAIEGAQKYGPAGSQAKYTVTKEGDRLTVSINDDPATPDVKENRMDLKLVGGGGTGLMLQIGDTADSYNQLRVNINDCHTAAIGIDKISIADQTSAQAAVDVIKDAINYISDVRGTLGATQNRLDHTINNLSVMTENIQDAESTIRDTDIAEEMMAYTKNNILIQASQAMLAQANQVPQGVLQLLQ